MDTNGTFTGKATRVIPLFNDESTQETEVEQEAKDEKTFTVEGLLSYDLENDPKSLIGNRWLCECSSLLITGPTGVGKSSFIMTLAVDWALGERPFGLAPARPLKTLIIQAENDEGDLVTPLQGLLSSRNLSKEQISELNKRIIFKQVATKTGTTFADYLRAQVEKHKPDIVIADPLLSYAGCGVSDQEKMTTFLRTDIQPILNETGVILAFVHHTGKPPKKKADADEERRSLYDSLGSTDLTNWAREVVMVSYEDWENRIFKLEFQKRAKRAGLVDEDGKPIYSLRIQHSKDRVAWEVVGDKPFTGKANTKAKAQRSSITAEIQEWTRETILERGTVSQSTLRALGGQAGYPAQKVIDAAELLADNNCGDKPIHKHKRGGVSYSLEPERSPEASREEKRTSQSRAVYDRIMELEFQTLDELKAWATSTEDAPGENSVKKFASDLVDGVNIFSDNVQVHPRKKASLVFSFGKHPMEFNEEVAKRRVAAEKKAASDPFA
jgi:hypothetical protein